MASPRDLTGVLRWWSADAPATTDGGRVTEAPDVVAGSVATRFGQGRVGPELVTVDGRPAWRFGGSAAPASLLTPDVPPVNGAPYSWAVVLGPTAGYAGQVLAPGPNTTVTSSSAQLLAATTGSFRWEGFAGATVSLPMPSGEQLVVLDHDGGTGATRLYATGQGSARATLQRRSLAGQQHLGRHGSNDRPLAADVRAVLLFDHALSDAEVATLEQWRTEGASSQATARSGAGTAAVRTRGAGSGAPVRAGAATSRARATTTGQGVPARSGAGSPRTTAPVSGAGQPVRAGADTARPRVLVGGTGAPVRDAAATTSTTTAAAGQGTPRRAGAGTSGVRVDATGTGAPGEVHDGAGTTRVLVEAAGTGRVVRAGTGRARSRTTSSGDGTPARARNGAHVVRAATTGDGTPHRAGLAATTLLVTATGTGVHGPDDGPVTPAPGGFTRTHGPLGHAPVLTAPRVHAGSGWQAGWRTR